MFRIVSHFTRLLELKLEVTVKFLLRALRIQYRIRINKQQFKVVQFNILIISTYCTFWQAIELPYATYVSKFAVAKSIKNSRDFLVRKQNSDF